MERSDLIAEDIGMTMARSNLVLKKLDKPTVSLAPLLATATGPRERRNERVVHRCASALHGQAPHEREELGVAGREKERAVFGRVLDRFDACRQVMHFSGKVLERGRRGQRPLSNQTAPQRGLEDERDTVRARLLHTFKPPVHVGDVACDRFIKERKVHKRLASLDG